jgi:hypothetical protein
VWEVIAAVRDNDGDAAETARYLEVPLGLVQAAITYYGAYRDEIDQWIEVNNQEAAEAHAAWMAGREALSDPGVLAIATAERRAVATGSPRPSKPRSTSIPVTTPSPTLRTGCTRDTQPPAGDPAG